MDRINNSISPVNLCARLRFAAAPIIVDVRRDADFSRAARIMIAPAFHRLQDQIENWGKELPSERSVVTYCADGDELSQGLAVSLRLTELDGKFLEGGSGIAGCTDRGLPTRRNFGSSVSKWVAREHPKIDRIYDALYTWCRALLRRRVRRAPALVIAALVVCAPPTASAQDAGGAVNIGHSTGGPPAHFDFLPAGEGQRPPWTLIEDKTAVAGLAIERRGAAAAVARSLAIYQAASLKEAEISLRIKATGGKQDQGGGIAVRLTSPDNYYLVQLDARRDRILFSRVANGVFEEIVGVDADLATGEWHRVAVRAVDDEFFVSGWGLGVYGVRQDFLARGAHRALERHRQRHAFR